jgi:hypothetical protein
MRRRVCHKMLFHCKFHITYTTSKTGRSLVNFLVLNQVIMPTKFLQTILAFINRRLNAMYSLMSNL